MENSLHESTYRASRDNTEICIEIRGRLLDHIRSVLSDVDAIILVVKR